MTAKGQARTGTTGTIGRAAPAVLLFASTLTVMAGTVLVPVLALIRDDLGIGSTAAGLLLTAHALSIAVAGPLAGWSIDRWGLRAPLVTGLLVYGLAGGAGLFVESYTALIISRLVFGVGAAAVFTGSTVALLTLYQGAERDRVIGRRSTAISFGGIVWPLLGGALGGISWHSPFAVYLVGLPVGVAMLWVLPSVPAAERGAGRGNTVRLLRLLPVRVWGLYAVSFVSSLLLYVLAVFLPQRLAQVGVERPFLVACYTMATSLSGAVAGLVYVRLRRRFDYAGLLRVAAAAWVAGLLVAGTAQHVAPLAAAPALFGLGMGVAVPTLTVLIGEGAPPGTRARATALSGTAAFTGQFVSPLLVWPLVGATSLRAGFLAAALLAGAVLLAVGAVRPAPPLVTAGAFHPDRHRPTRPVAGLEKNGDAA
ncbi:MFS transporter [Streptomyces camponoticapitis]|uniref:MFS transporter n=1 Tax=Streptomyces camponoticapitis TaxID=1616125 RepID=A0ABQ2EUJ5_9ACTN|nr:MFS transporter [Streptomyces camponoticapitis]GGK26415.1 MFS transporter [Streptomyces camponoticapitis]